MTIYILEIENTKTKFKSYKNLRAIYEISYAAFE
jgi:hypothetical protein